MAPGNCSRRLRRAEWVRPRICSSYLGWFLVLPLVLGGSVGPGELLQEVAQGRVGQVQDLTSYLWWFLELPLVPYLVALLAPGNCSRR